MTKSRLLVIAVAVLAVLNIALIAMLLLGKPDHPRNKGKQGPKKVLIERLNFDQSQINAYEELISEHKKSVSAKEKELKTAKNNLYLSLSAEDQNEKDELIAKVNGIQKDFEEIHYNHFLAIKKLCKPNQLQDFNDLTGELAKIFAPHKPLAKPKK